MEHRLAEQERQLTAKLAAARSALLLGVGGGNDSVTTLLARAQLSHDFGFAPARTVVAAMLPDILEYQEVTPTAAPRVWRIRPESRRFVQGKPIRGFPEPLLAREKARFGIEEVLGILLSAGSEGVHESLRDLVRAEGFDLVLACDVGGDFIATPENRAVLSPMMDGYALHALRQLAAEEARPELVFCVFGLGTDGETTPGLLRRALGDVGEHLAGRFDPALVADVEQFYRRVVEPNRYSYTCDLTLRTLRGDPLPARGLRHRARFHTWPERGQTRSYLAAFPFTLDPDLAGRYYLFDSLRGIRNPFAFTCRSGIEWFLKVQRFAPRGDHELNGQSYPDVATTLGLPRRQPPQSLYFATPSGRFDAADRRQIAQDTLQSLRNGVYDLALVAAADVERSALEGLARVDLTAHLALLGRSLDQELIQALQTLAT